MPDMRTLLDIVDDRRTADEPTLSRPIREGDVVSLGAVKQQRQDAAVSKAANMYSGAVGGIIDGMRAQYAAEGGKFEGILSKFVQDPEPFGEKKVYFGLAVAFRDYSPSPVARKIIPVLRQMRLKNTRTRTSYAKEFQGTKEGPYYQGEIAVGEAVRLFKGRQTEEIAGCFGAYMPSVLGFGLDFEKNYNDEGVGFRIWLGNWYDGHVIDSDDDLRAALGVYRRFLDVVKSPSAGQAPSRPNLSVVDNTRTAPPESFTQGNSDLDRRPRRGGNHLRPIE